MCSPSLSLRSSCSATTPSSFPLQNSICLPLPRLSFFFSSYLYFSSQHLPFSGCVICCTLSTLRPRGFSWTTSHYELRSPSSRTSVFHGPLGWRHEMGGHDGGDGLPCCVLSQRKHCIVCVWKLVFDLSCTVSSFFHLLVYIFILNFAAGPSGNWTAEI